MVALTTKQIQALRDRIDQAGGLVNASDLARHWNVSRERVSQLVRSAGFPEPLGHVGGRPVWLCATCDAWRAQR